ncbi:MAG: phosphohydrolase [Desulfotalea sp.]|nr:MAG: phosphohydrolase [Desulfotalea sp.]
MADYTVRKEDIALLKEQGMVAEDLEHSLQVAEKALEIGRRMQGDLDMVLLGRGALFHDLGKTTTHGITHGLLGAEKGADLGLPAAVNAIMEKHIRGGLTEEEAVELGLPVKDYTLHLLEERVIIYADRLVDIIHDGIVQIDDEREAETRFKEILRDEIKYGKNDITTERYYRYHDEIQSLMKIQAS